MSTPERGKDELPLNYLARLIEHAGDACLDRPTVDKQKQVVQWLIENGNTLERPVPSTDTFEEEYVELLQLVVNVARGQATAADLIEHVRHVITKENGSKINFDVQGLEAL